MCSVICPKAAQGDADSKANDETQSWAKYAEKTRANSYVDRFLYKTGNKLKCILNKLPELLNDSEIQWGIFIPN